jgi:hypothetical protein
LASSEKSSAACQVATLGLGDDREVLDEPYRNEGKMDKEHFACKLNQEVPKILSIARPMPFTDDEEKVDTRSKCYKLIVYRASPFSSISATYLELVHQGQMGPLNRIRTHPRQDHVRLTRDRIPDSAHRRHSPLHQGIEVTVARLYHALFRTARTFQCLRYLIEHEVMPVTASHRIMVTYNFRLVDDERKDDDSSSSSDGTFVSTQSKDYVTSLWFMLYRLPSCPKVA